MDQKYKDMFSKTKNTAFYVADIAGKKSKEVYQNSKSSLKSVELNAEIDAIYKEIGKLVYQSQMGEDVAEDTVLEKVKLISQKQEEILELKDKKDMLKNTVVCKNCKTIGRKDEGYCANCGIKF